MKKFNFILLITLSGLVILTVVGLIVLSHTMIVHRFSAFLAQKSITLSLIRGLLLVLLAYFWPVVIKFLAKWQTWPVDIESGFIVLRWPIVCCLILFEILVMQNILARCIDFFVH